MTKIIESQCDVTVGSFVTVSRILKNEQDHSYRDSVMEVLAVDWPLLLVQEVRHRLRLPHPLSWNALDYELMTIDPSYAKVLKEAVNV